MGWAMRDGPAATAVTLRDLSQPTTGGGGPPIVANCRCYRAFRRQDLARPGADDVDRPISIVADLPSGRFEPSANAVGLREIARRLGILPPHRPADGPRAL